MNKTFKKLICAVLSLAFAVSCFVIPGAAEEAPTSISFAECDSVTSGNPAPAIDNKNYTQGTGSSIQQWESRSNFSTYFPRTSGVDITGLAGVTGTVYLNFDIFVKDEAEINNIQSLNRLVVFIGGVDGIEGWKQSFDINIKDGSYNANVTVGEKGALSKSSGWIVGWNHVSIPLNLESDFTQNTDKWDPKRVGFVRFMADGFNRAGYFQVDDIYFAGETYMDNGADMHYNAAKDVEVAIRTLPDVMTADDGALLESVTAKYNAFFKIRVNSLSHPINNYDDLLLKQLEYDYKFCNQAGDFDVSFGKAYASVPDDVTTLKTGYTAKDRCYTQNWPDTTKFHSMTFYDDDGLNISGAVNEQNRFYVTFDIFIDDVAAFLNRGRLLLYLGSTDAIDDAIYSGSTKSAFTTVMLYHWCGRRYVSNSTWKQGWNTIGVCIDLDDLSEEEKELFDIYSLGYVRVWSDSNKNEGAGTFTLGDVHIMSVKSYYENIADIKSAKEVVYTISNIGNVDKAAEGRINDARAAYDAAEQSVKDKVTNYTVLTNAETYIANCKAAAAEVDAKIDAIGEVTKEKAELVTDAQKSYNDLDAVAKSYVEKLETLTAAVDAYATLLAKDIDDLIDAIGEVNENSGDAITAARTAYDGAAETVKAKVTKLEKLIAAEEKFAEFGVVYGNVDMSEDNKVTATDALLALQASVGKVVLDEKQTKAADVDGVSGVTATDALLILQYSVGKITKFPVEEK